MRLALLALLAACHGKGDDAPGGDGPGTVELGCTTDEDCGTSEICGTSGECEQGERNDSPAGATPLDLSDEPETPGVINPPGDVDWFVYSSPGDEWVDIRTVTAGDPVGNLDTVVRLWRPDGTTEYAAMDNFPTGRVGGYDSVLRAYLPDAGDWYVTVEDVTSYYTDLFDASDERGDESYTYSVGIGTFTALARETDSKALPNVDLDLADGNTIWSVGIKLDDPGDSDWLAVNLTPAGEPLEVWSQADDYGSSIDLEVRLYDPTGTLISDKSSVGPGGYLSYFDPASGSYTVEATDVSGAGASDAWAVLAIRTYEPGDIIPFFADNVYTRETEPNEDPAEANAIPTVDQSASGIDETARFEGELLFDGDVDSYSFDVPAGDEVSLRCFVDRFGSLADLAVKLLDPDLSDVTPAGQGSDPTAGEYYVYNVLAPGGGTWTVQLSSEDATFGPQDYYRCIAQLTDVDIDPG